jgi:hypothetical protein
MITVRNIPKIAIDKPAFNVALNKAASDIVLRIKMRTASGQDVNGKAFEKYKTNENGVSQYVKYKQKHGKTGATVNLTFTGTLLQSLKTTQVSFDWVQIFINNATRDFIGKIHQKGEGSQPVREWFGVSKTDGDKILKKNFVNAKIGVFVK